MSTVSNKNAASNEITATTVDANHPHLQGLQSLFRQLHQRLEAIDNLERRCHLFSSHLHETALQLVFPGIASGFRNDLNAAVAELRANTLAHEGQLDRAPPDPMVMRRPASNNDSPR
jgi:hypothetical protein